MDDAPLIPSPLFGLRTWRVAVDEGGERLVAAHRGTPWPGGGRWLTAVCDAGLDHEAPAVGCDCGIHAWHPSAAAAKRVLGTRAEVAGVVEAAGRVELHEQGFRAERARPHTLVVGPRSNACAVRRLADRHGVPVVTVGSAAELAAYCRERGLGLAPSVVAELMGPERLGEARREVALQRRRTTVRALLYAALAAAVLAFGAQYLSGPPSAKGVYGRTGWVIPPKTTPAAPPPAARETSRGQWSRCEHGGTDQRARDGRRGRARTGAASRRCRSR